MDAEELREHGHKMVDFIADYYKSIETFPVLSQVEVPKGWDKLSLSIISVETGKTLAKTGRASVQNGNCQWTENLQEYISVPHDDASKGLEQCLHKLLISMGSGRSSTLGEVTVNLSNHLYVSGYKNRFQNFIKYLREMGDEVFGALAIAKMLSVPIVMSYHTHVPVYIPRYTFSWLVQPMWLVIKFLHRAADLTLVPSAAIAKDLEQYKVAAGACKKG